MAHHPPRRPDPLLVAALLVVSLAYLHRLERALA